MRGRVSYWLIPVDADKRRLQAVIDELAAQFNAPVFEPHVTLYSGEMEHIEDAADVLEGIAGEFPMALQSRALGHSDRFTQALFMEFAPDPAVNQMSDDFKLLSKATDHYELNPHLSLVYATVSSEVRKRLSRDIIVPGIVRFDAIKAIATGERTQLKSDVEKWQVLAERGF